MVKIGRSNDHDRSTDDKKPSNKDVHKEYTEKELLDWLHKIDSKVDGDPELTHIIDNDETPHLEDYVLEFGSFTDALIEAGINERQSEYE